MKKTASRTNNSVLNIITGIGGQMCTIILKFVVRTVFIHALGKSYLGINGLFSNVLTLLSLTELGFDTAINFKLYKPLADGDDKRVRVLMKFYKQAYRVIGMVILILGICLIPVLPYIIKDYDTMAILGINAVLIFLLHIGRTVCSYWFFAYRAAILKANQKKYIIDIVEFFANIATSVAKIIVLVFFKDFVLYTSTVIVFNVLQNCVNAYIVKRKYPQFFDKEEENLSRSEIIDMMKDCAALFVYKINNVVVKATDNIVISAYIGLGDVGIYSNYALFYSTARTLFDKVYAAVKASMGNLFATESVEKQYRFFQIMNYISAVLFGTACCGVAVCGDELIKLWVGPEYVVGNMFALLIGIEIFFHGLRINLGQVRSVSGVFQQMWFRPVLGIFVNLGISIALVQVCGLHGVIIGTIVSDITTNFLIDPKVIHKYSFHDFKPVSEYYRKNLGYIVVLSAVTLLNFWICKVLFIGYGWFSLIFHGIMIAITVPSAYILIYWRTPENKYLFAQGKRMLKKIQKRL